jgi:hypothetical protein
VESWRALEKNAANPKNCAGKCLPISLSTIENEPVFALPKAMFTANLCRIDNERSECSAMKLLVMKSRFGWSKLHVFVSGLILGAVVAISSPGFSADEDVVRRAFTNTLYALAELAVDTETNASRIVALVERVEHLEERLEEMSGEKK